MTAELQSEVESELRRLVKGEVRFDRYSQTLYSTDASIYQIPPLGVVVPRRPEDLQAVLDVAGRYGVPVLPRGGGTSLAGQTVGPAIQVDFSKHLNRVGPIAAEERWVEVEPGAVLGHLNAQLAAHGLMFAPDPATAEYACIGGALGNNSSGARSLVYGKTVNHVLELGVLTASGRTLQLREMDRPALESTVAGGDGVGELHRQIVELVRANADEILESFPRILRRVSGYNLDELLRGLRAAGYHELPEWSGAQAPQARVPGGFSLAPLMVGSEGSLAMITRARLNLVPRPQATGLLVCHFRSLEEALEGNQALLEMKPCASELMDRMLIDLARRQLEISRLMTFVEGEPEAILVGEFDGTESEVLARLQAARAHLRKKGLGYAHLVITDPAGMGAVWKVRKAGLPLLLGLPGRRKPVAFVEDTAVAPERLIEYVRRFDEIVREEGTTAAYYAHASVGCLHIRPLLDLKSAEDVERMGRLADRITDLVCEFGGSISGEHGDGLARGAWNEKLFGEPMYQVFRRVKAIFDPRNLMNPGKVVDSPEMTRNLRFGGEYRAEPPRLALDWSREGGFAEAVELCNGAGVCRKKNRGTMCPSYMVTCEEEHTTRGRANLLRAGLSGRLARGELTSRRMYDALDLCIECKGCKAECPSNVDMAKLKLEFLAGYYREHAVPLRTRLFGYADWLNRLGCALAPVSGWAARWVAPLVGIHPERLLPPFARQTFWEWWRRRSRGPGGTGVVALFVDTFTAYNYPEIGRAAVRVLESAGYRVEIADRVCCGRTMISKGLVEPARARARENLRRLRPYVERGIPIVGLEPSCILSMRDEYRDLVPGAETESLGRACLTFEEFLGDVELPLARCAEPILLHGHCHQKALVGTGPSLQLLRRLGEVREVDSGCCGMAGSFGFEKEHYEISRAIGESRLLPAVRAHRGHVVAAGVSCRQQVLHFAGVRAYHPAELLERYLS
ncbi:MAG: FAD-binding protein [Armatimonadetes bacterium]|nr:FAD-binding protein [Armatimonadota bacterium]